MDSLTEELVRQLHRNPRDTSLLESVRVRLTEQRRFRALAALLEWWSKKAPTPQAAAQSLYDAAVALNENGTDSARAIELLLQAIGRDPAHEAASREAEAMLVSAGVPERVADALERQAGALAAGIYPRGARATVLARLGRLRAKHLSDLDGAIEAFRQAVNAEPAHVAVAEELIGLYLTRAHRGDRAVAEADHQRAAELYHRLAKQVGGPSSVPYLESALDLAPGYVEALEMLERIAPSMKPQPDMKPRWRAFIDSAGPGTSADQRRHMLAKAYVAEDQLSLAVETMLPLAERGDERAQRTVEQLQRRLGLDATPFLTPEERSEIALLEFLRSQDEGALEWEESDTTTGVRDHLETSATGVVNRPTGERSAPGRESDQPTIDPSKGVAPIDLPESEPPKPAMAAARPSTRSSPQNTTQLGLGPPKSAEKKRVGGPDDDLPTTRAVVSDELLSAISASASLLESIGSSDETDGAHRRPSEHPPSDPIPPEDTIRADVSQHRPEDDRWDPPSGELRAMPSGEATVDVVSAELSSYDGTHPPASAEAVLPDGADDEPEETTVTGRVSLALRSQLAGSDDEPTTGTTLFEPEPSASARSTDPGPEPAHTPSPDVSKSGAIRDRTVTPALGMRSSNPAVIDETTVLPKGRPMLLVRRTTGDRVLDEQIVTAPIYSPRSAPIRVRIASDGATVELTAPGRCLVERRNGERQDLTGPTMLSIATRDTVSIEHEGVTHTLRLQRGDPPPRSRAFLAIALIATAAVVALIAGATVYKLVSNARSQEAITAGDAAVPVAIVPAVVRPDATVAAHPDATIADASVPDAAIADASLDATLDASPDAEALAASFDAGATPTLHVVQLVRLEGGLRRGSVLAGIGTAHPAILDCWITAMNRGTQPGDLGISFVVNNAGRARGVQRTSGSIEDEALVACVRDAFASARFGRPRGGNAEAIFAFGVR